MTNKEIISRILTTLPTSYFPFKKSWYSVSLSYRTLDRSISFIQDQTGRQSPYARRKRLIIQRLSTF